MTEDLSLSGLRNRFNQLHDLNGNFVGFSRRITSGFGASPGGGYGKTDKAGVFNAYIGTAPGGTSVSIGFRAAL